MDADQSLDLTGLSCPLPLLKAKHALHKMNSGETLKVVATDPGSLRDFKAFSDNSDHQLLSAEVIDGKYYYFLQRG